MPKSVSLYLVEAGDRAVERMIHESFRETMLDIESRMETRVRGKGEDGEERNDERTTRNLVYASFVHTETRPIDGIPDPHYHIHALRSTRRLIRKKSDGKQENSAILNAMRPSTKRRSMPVSPTGSWTTATQSAEPTATLSLRACLES